MHLRQRSAARPLAGIAREIAREEKLQFKLAAIHSEQDKTYLKQKLAQGKITPLANAPHLDEGVIDRSAHIVGMAGYRAFRRGSRQRRAT